jgi:hypothetical protein
VLFHQAAIGINGGNMTEDVRVFLVSVLGKVMGSEGLGRFKIFLGLN